MAADDVINLDINHLTTEEIEEIEERSGVAIDAFGDPKQPKGKLLRSMAFIVRKRDDPSFTWEQAGKLKVVLGEQPVPPTDAAG